MNREEWLMSLAKKLHKPFLKAGYEIPGNLRISTGFPSRNATSLKNRTVGQCWADTATADATYEIFISPLLDGALEVAGTLVHELGHACVPTFKHGKPFQRFMDALGLEGKPKATTLGEDLTDLLQSILKALEPYPAGCLRLPEKTQKTQTTRMLKAQCSGCGYTVRAAKRYLDLGSPLCPIQACLHYQEAMLRQVSESDEPQRNTGYQQFRVF